MKVATYGRDFLCGTRYPFIGKISHQDIGLEAGHVEEDLDGRNG